jgi:hypothetical protein
VCGLMLDPLAPSTTRGTTQDKTQENKSLKGVDTINKGDIIGSTTTTQTGQHKMNRYNIYEIYVKDIITGESGADLKSIVAFNREDASTYPFFDEVVMYEGTMGNNQDAVRESGLPLTHAVSASLRA